VDLIFSLLLNFDEGGMTDTYAAAIDGAGIASNWPTGHAMPKLIADLGALMSPWPWGALGHWRMKGERFEEFWGQWLKDGAALDGQFGIFMGLAGGANYAIWYHPDDAPGAHPVVYFPDDNRDISIQAPNIKAFFTEWASGRGIGWLDPFDYEATPELLAERTAYGRRMLAIIEAMPEPPAGRPHDELQDRLTATCSRAFAVIDEKDRQRRLTEIYGDRIDLVSPQKYWPKTRQYPQLIADMGALIKPWVNSSIGRCDFVGRVLPDKLFDHAADLHEQFGFFLVDHRYRWVAVWYHDGAIPGAEPVVGFHEYSPADAVILAPSLKAFFAQWAEAVAAGDPSYGLHDEPEIVAQRPALADKMRDLVRRTADGPTGTPIPDLASFVRGHIERERAKDAADPLLKEIAAILRGRFPAATATLDESYFATVKGDTLEYSMIVQELAPEHFPEGRALTPLLLQARSERARGPTASLGPWTSALLSLHPDGRLAVSAYWEG
jgi:hypothetical protein